MEKVNGIDVRTVRPILTQGKDPIRYPKIVNVYEGAARRIFNTLQNDMFTEVVKEMVHIQKNKH